MRFSLRAAPLKREPARAAENLRPYVKPNYRRRRLAWQMLAYISTLCALLKNNLYTRDFPTGKWRAEKIATTTTTTTNVAHFWRAGRRFSPRISGTLKGISEHGESGLQYQTYLASLSFEDLRLCSKTEAVKVWTWASLRVEEHSKTIREINWRSIFSEDLASERNRLH